MTNKAHYHNPSYPDGSNDDMDINMAPFPPPSTTTTTESGGNIGILDSFTLALGLDGIFGGGGGGGHSGSGSADDAHVANSDRLSFGSPQTKYSKFDNSGRGGGRILGNSSSDNDKIVLIPEPVQLLNISSTTTTTTAPDASTVSNNNTTNNKNSNSRKDDDDNNKDNNNRMTENSLDLVKVDDMLSKELMKISFNDRNLINEEVHGVECLAPTETPDLIQQSLYNLTVEIDNITSKSAFVYARDVLNSTFIFDESLRLRFLRSELFQPSKAAQRFVGFLDVLWDYYGDAGLTRPIKLSDLNREEMDLLKSGDYQLLPFRDRSGRKLFTMVGQAGLYSELRTRIKVLIYLYWAMADDVETQRRGMVLIYCPNFENGLVFPDKNEMTEAERVIKNAPVRMVSMHHCLPEGPLFRLLKGLSILVLSADERARAKFHQGSTLELKYTLLGYGIPIDLIPVTESGKVKTKNWTQWLKTRRAIEQRTDVNPVECPFLNDVAFRLGKSYLSHPGNSLYRGLLEQSFQSHNQAKSSVAKKEVTWNVIDDVERRGGRFLVWDKPNGWWTVLTDRNQIRAKVAISLKEQKKKTMQLENRQSLIPNPYQFERQDGRKRKRDQFGVEANTCACF